MRILGTVSRTKKRRKIMFCDVTYEQELRKAVAMSFRKSLISGLEKVNGPFRQMSTLSYSFIFEKALHDYPFVLGVSNTSANCESIHTF